MRPLEFFGFLFAMLPALALASILPTAVGLGAAAVSCGILLTAALRLGAYWQLIPLYSAAVLGLGLLVFLAQSPRWTRIAGAVVVTCLLLMTAAFTYVLPMFRLPQPTGKYAVGTRTVNLVDPHRMETHVSGPRRPREIMVQVWYPATPEGQHLASYRMPRETTRLSSYMAVLWTHSFLNAPVATARAPFPVLIFNPSWGGQRTQNTYQTEDLASHGFIVAGIDHTYNTGPVAFPDGRIIRPAESPDISDFSHTTVTQQIAIGDREAAVQAADDTLTLDYLAAANLDPRSPWFQRVNTNDAGAFGHSFGGAASAEACYQDPRIKAAINMDGWVFGDVATHGLNKPYLVMYEQDVAVTPDSLQSADIPAAREAQRNAIDAANLHRTLRQHGGYLLTLAGSKHNDFSDRSLYSPLRRLTEGGRISPRLAHRIVEDYTLQFFSHYLKNEPAPLLAATRSPYKEVQFENWFTKDSPTN